MECTIVSIYPIKIEGIEIPGLFPGRFTIEKGSTDKPSLTYIGDSKHYIDIGEDRPRLTQYYSADKVAKSIVDDWMQGKWAVAPGLREPGIFWLEGHVSMMQLKRDHQDKIDAQIKMQREWFLEIVRLSDDEWSKAPGKHRLITDDARQAARILGLDKAWISDIVMTQDTLPCPFCTTLIKKESIICYNCKQVVKEGYDGLKVPGVNQIGKSVVSVTK